ncbi:hypothetical protein ACTMS0_24500 [Micromonospora sp. H33]|uniref:hypothetical protein n=1 Tax=Micromonospora sp. H33 TaxID=3452215 RepID=UPI003F8971A6
MARDAPVAARPRAGQVARLADTWAAPTYVLTFGLASVALGLGAVMFTRHIRHLMAGIH